MKQVNLKELFLRKQNGLDTMYYNTTHNGESGSYLEEKAKDLLKEFIAQQYEVRSGFIVDINQKISQQIDIVVYQKSVHPPLFDEINYFFRESVALIGEVKASVSKAEFKYTVEKMESVSNLKYEPGLLRVHGSAESRVAQVDNKDKFIKLLFGYKTKLTDKKVIEHFENSDLDICYIVNNNKNESILLYKENGTKTIVGEDALYKLLFIINHVLITKINNTNPVSYKGWLNGQNLG